VKERGNVQQHRRRKRRASSGFNWTTLATIVGLWVTLTTATLTLLSYGHDFAFLEATVALHPEDVRRTPLDLLLRGWRPVLAGLKGLSGFVSVDTQLKLISTLWQRAGMLLVGFATTWMFVVAVLRRPRRRAIAAAVLRRQHGRSAWRRMRQVVRPIFSRARDAAKWLWSSRLVFAGWLAIPGFFALLLTLAWGLWFVAAIWAILVVGAPVIGAASGQARAVAEVTGDVLCRWPSDGTYAGASCVAVVDNNREVARGRIIDFGEKRLLLYQPCSRSVVSMQVEGRSVVTLRRLAAPRHMASCR
jgi:hypothetical protein